MDYVDPGSSPFGGGWEGATNLVRAQWDMVHNPAIFTPLQSDADGAVYVDYCWNNRYSKWTNVPNSLRAKIDCKKDLRYTQICNHTPTGSTGYGYFSRTYFLLLDGSIFYRDVVNDANNNTSKTYDKIIHPDDNQWSDVNINDYQTDELAKEIKVVIEKGITEVAKQTGRYIIPAEDASILFTGKDFDGVETSRFLAATFLLVEFVPGGKLVKPITKGIKAAIKPTVAGSRKIYSFVKGTKKVVGNFASDIIIVNNFLDGKIDEAVDVVENVKFKNKTGQTVEGSLEIVTQGDEVGALIIKQAGLFEPDYLIRVANDPNKIMPFVTKYVNELTTPANIARLWSLGGATRGRLIEAVLAVTKYQPQGYKFVGGWNYKYIDFVDDVEVEIVEEIASLVENVVSLKTFNTSKVGAEALAAFKQSLQRSAKALNDATLPAAYSNSNKVLDIVVKKEKFNLDDLKLIWEEVKTKYPNVKEARFDEF